VLIRTTLYGVMLVLTVSTLAITEMLPWGIPGRRLHSHSLFLQRHGS
jgi:hypothetical protein